MVTKKIRLKDLAEAEGISIAQVSRALRSGYGVSPEIRDRVLRLAQELNYRNCSSNHNCKIAMLTNGLGNFSQILPKMNEEFEKRKWRKLIIPCEDYEILSELLVDGIFFFGYNSLSAKFPETLFRYPIVEINDYAPALEECASVMPDADGEMELAMKHLVELGHRKILRLFYDLPNATLNWQKRGVQRFYAVADAYGLANTVRSEYYCSREEQEQFLVQALNAGVTAVIDGTREPVKLLHIFHRMGKRIPEDVSLITYEEQGSSQWLFPAMTTLDFDYDAIAENAVLLMVKSLRNRCREQIIVPSKLIVRNSTGPAPLV